MVFVSAAYAASNPSLVRTVQTSRGVRYMTLSGGPKPRKAKPCKAGKTRRGATTKTGLKRCVKPKAPKPPKCKAGKTRRGALTKTGLKRCVRRRKAPAAPVLVVAG